MPMNVEGSPIEIPNPRRMKIDLHAAGADPDLAMKATAKDCFDARGVGIMLYDARSANAAAPFSKRTSATSRAPGK